MKKIRNVLTMSLAVIFQILNTQSFAEEIVIVGNEYKPPKYYIEDGEAKGILIDIMKYVDAELPSSFIYELYPWGRAYSYASQGKAGIIGLSKNKQRLEQFDFSDVIYYDSLILVVLKGNEFSYQNISDLQTKRIGVRRGSSYGEEYEQYKEHLELVEDNSGEIRLLKLLKKRIDVAIIGPGKAGLMSVISKSKELTSRKDEFSILPNPFRSDPNYFAFSKEMHKQDLIMEFNQILEKANKSGEIQTIIDAHID